MKIFTVFLITFTIILVFSCKKGNPANQNTDEGLPVGTQTVASIFACKINGQNWISGQKLSLIGGTIFNVTVSARGSNGGTNYFDQIIVRIDGGALNNNIFLIPGNLHAQIIFCTNKSCEGLPGSAIINSYAAQGKITISKIDASNKIIAGIFECKVPIPNCDTLIITNVRFDIKLF